MTGYTKLFSSIITSTIWRESPVVCKVWVTMLALADRYGVVEGSIPGLAHLASVSVDEASEAIQRFLSPDPYSRSPEWGGRRIEPVDGGWRLLNHDKYRAKMSPEDIRERDRIRKQIYRDQKNAECPTIGGTTRDNTGQTGNVREIQHTEAEAEAINQNLSSNARASDDSDLMNALQGVWDYYITGVGKNPKTYSFTPLRKRKGTARLKECIGKTETLADAVALMKDAVDGLVSSPWHMGQDAKTNGKKYCDWESNLFKSYEQMEKWWDR
jgi:hypothetical protein